MHLWLLMQHVPVHNMQLYVKYLHYIFKTKQINKRTYLKQKTEFNEALCS